MNRYRLVEHLGSGGMAVVYRAVDEMLNRDVAIKFMAAARFTEQDSSERFNREARAIARLSHPGIVALYDVGQESDWHYLVLEYVPGSNLQHVLKKYEKALPVPTNSPGYQT